MTTLDWAHANFTANANGCVQADSPYTPGKSILQFGGWAEVPISTSEYQNREGSSNDVVLLGTCPALDGDGKFVQGVLMFAATPGATVRVHSWAVRED